MTDHLKVFFGPSFEEEVRRVARLIWASDEVNAQIVHGRERDGVYEGDEIIYIIEATTLRTRKKIEDDGKKTNDTVKELRRTSGKFAKGFLVTLHDPTADQIEAARPYSKTLQLLSFDEFKSKLVDARSYLSNRESMPFGSIYDFSANNQFVPREDFIAPSIQLIDSPDELSLSNIYESIGSGGRFALLAEYGTGKSMCLREIFFNLSRLYYSKQSIKFPVYINLRDHMGQQDVVELLERHGRLVGMSRPQELVRAWRAGYVDLLLDGFDELSSRGWTGDARRIRELRRSTQGAVRNLIRHSHNRSGIIIAGRAGYFDTLKEMTFCLSIDTFKIIRVLPFNDLQVSLYLRKKNLAHVIPDWVPTRPLLLGYLASRGIISDICENGAHRHIDKGEAWAELLSMIARREAEQLEGTDPETLLHFLAKLATRARNSDGGLGRFSPIEVEDLFFRVTGRTPIDDDRNMLLRLPGLGSSPDSSGSRSFIDSELADAAAGYEIVHYLRDPHDQTKEDYLKDIRFRLRDTGTQVASHLTKISGIHIGAVVSAINVAQRRNLHQTSYDIFNVAIELGYTPQSAIRFTECDVGIVDIEDTQDFHDEIVFNACSVDTVIIPIDASIRINCRFSDCLINNIIGRISPADLPEKNFIQCVYGDFTESPDRNNAVLETDIPESLKVLVISLRKLYQQKGAGRKENALYRGLDAKSRPLVPEIIELLKKHRYVFEVSRRGEIIYSPNRNKAGEAITIIRRPLESKKDIVKDCLSLS